MAPDLSRPPAFPVRAVVTGLLVACALALVPLFAGKFGINLTTKIMILAIFALSLELLVGQTGLVSFGHAAYLGIAAYAVALLTPESATAQIWVVLPLALVASALYALFVGILSLRTRGIYFIMVTLAFAQMAYFVFHDTPLGGGSDGIYVYSRPDVMLGGWRLIDLDSKLGYYYFVLGCLVATATVLALLVRSRFGRALSGIRVNEQRMRAAGFATFPYKLAAFVIAAVFAGLAGFLLALKDGFVNPELLSWHESGAVLIMIILGGLGSLWGAMIGAGAFVLLQEFFQSDPVFGDLARHWQLSLGVTIIICVALMPQGLIGLGRQFGRRLGVRRGGGHA